MAFNLIPGNSDQQGLVTNMNQTILELKNQEVTKLFRDSTGTPVVKISKDGLQTTPPESGIDVTTATAAQYSFNSAQNTFKVVYTGILTLNHPINTSSSTVTYTHGLGFTPSIIAFVDEVSSFTSPVPVPQINFKLSGADAGKITSSYRIYTDGTTVTASVLAPNYVGNADYTDAYTLYFKFFLFQESIV